MKLYYKKYNDGHYEYFKSISGIEEALLNEVGSLYYYGDNYTDEELDSIYSSALERIKDFDEEILCGEAYFGVIQNTNLIIFPDKD